MLLWNGKRKLDAHRSTFVEPKKQKSSDGGFIVPRPNAGRAVASLAGKNVVLAGVFPQLGGEGLGKARARAMIESFGGRVASFFSGKTDVLLVGTGAEVTDMVFEARGQPGCMVVSLEKMCELLHAENMLPDKGTAATEELTKTTKITSFFAGYWPKGGTHTPGGPNTPATTNSGGTPAKLARPGDSSGSEGGVNNALHGVDKKARALWCAEATALGYDAGTIKSSAYVLLAASRATGMTVDAIVDAVTKQG